MRLSTALSAVTIVVGVLVDSTRAHAGQATLPGFVYEIWYEVDPDRGHQFDEYLERLKEASPRMAGSPERWVDVHRASNRRLVSLPVVRLADYRSDRYNEAGLRSMLGDDAYAALFKGYSEAQIWRQSYIREFRAELSINRQHYTRDGLWATEYTLVTIEPGKETRFERLWIKALSAYLQMSPLTILLCERTLVGGGPQYVIARPLKARSDIESVPAPIRAVEQVFGPAEAQAFANELEQVVRKWEPLVFEKTNLDSHSVGPGPEARR